MVDPDITTTAQPVAEVATPHPGPPPPDPDLSPGPLTILKGFWNDSMMRSAFCLATLSAALRGASSYE